MMSVSQNEQQGDFGMELLLIGTLALVVGVGITSALVTLDGIIGLHRLNQKGA